MECNFLFCLKTLLLKELLCSVVRCCLLRLAMANVKISSLQNWANFLYCHHMNTCAAPAGPTEGLKILGCH